MAEPKRTVLIAVVSRYATSANPRNALIAELSEPTIEVVFVSRRRGLRHPIAGAKILPIRQPPLAYLAKKIRLSDGIVRMAARASFQSGLLLALLRLKLGALLRRRRLVLHISVPPGETIRPALAIKKCFPSTRIIFDWQDPPCSEHEGNVADIPRCLFKTERAAIATGDLSVYVTEQSRGYQQEMTGVGARAFEIIPHYFECEILPLRNKSSYALPSRAIQLGFLGNFNKPPKVPGVALLPTLDEAFLCEQVKAHLTLVGDRSLSRKFIDRYSWLYSIPRLPHQEAIETLKQFDAFVLVLADTPYCRTLIHAKLPYYLALRRPILGIVPGNSVVGTLLSEFRVGPLVDTANEVTSDLISQAVGALRAWRMPESTEYLDQFRWVNSQQRWRAAYSHLLGMHSSEGDQLER